jgi:cellulose synthase/poly-beta-1,6-N-acetylglucosamine synthase-like glycosyltransferase
MTFLITITIILIGLHLLIQIILLCSIAFTSNEKPADLLAENEWPAISILVAARNEETNIERCLQALHQLDYPKEKLQILMGNDHSEDRTHELVAAFIIGKPQFTLIDIEKPLGKARGKANVLAQLAHKATGDFYFITDADIAVSSQWAKELVQHFDTPDMGIVSGTTVVEDAGLMGKMQGIDWAYFMGLIKGFATLGVQCTAVGNNMAIRKEAYWITGGYESFDFSIVEDYKLFKEVRLRGWDTKNILTEGTTNRSVSIKGMMNLLHQRKRWLMGGRELPFYWWLIFGLFSLFLPLIVVLAFFHLQLALGLYAVKLVLQSATVHVLYRKMKMEYKSVNVLLYDVYTNIISFVTQVFFVLPVKTIWKKRTYKL